MNVLRLLQALATGALVLGAAGPTQAEIFESQKELAGTTVQYKVVLPEGYVAGTTYPGVLVFGGGPQTMPFVNGTLALNFRDEAEKRGYIVIAPAAPNGDRFFEDGARIFPEFLDAILADYEIRHEKFHVAGPSNGGIAAMHVAAEHPSYFVSVTAFPGYLWQSSSEELRSLAEHCVFLYIGEHDEYGWHDEMQTQSEFLRALGAVARYTVEEDQSHRLETLEGPNSGRLFDGFEEAEQGCGG
jgi:poly(3-hydroxybutyrate) depolymerase